MAVEDLWQDLVVALRGLRTSPSYALVVILTLGLGISANTTIFSFMNPYLIRDLPFGDPDHLVQVGQVDPTTGWGGGRFSLPQILDWGERTRAFEDLAAYWYTVKNVTGNEGPERILAGVVSANMFEVLRAEPALGRGFVPEEEGPGGADVVVLSHGLWQRRYGADRNLIGETIRLDGIAHSVVGVMDPDFNFPFGSVKMWVPIREDATSQARELDQSILVGRLKPDWTRERAREELESIQAELSAIHPDSDGKFDGVTVKPIREALNFAWDVLMLSFVVLLAAVGFVLLIACVNVASLSLARTSARARDVAVRAALGASRARLVRQHLAESLLLALAGGSLGILLAYWGASMVGPLIPEDLYRIGEVTVDRTVLLYSLLVTLSTPLVFGLGPALSAARTDLTTALKEGGHGGGAALTGRRALVVAEVAMAIVLIGGTGLMLRSFLEIQDVDLGFRPEGVLTVDIAPSEIDYPTAGEQQGFFDRTIAAVRALPAVESAGLVTPLPLNHTLYNFQYARPDRVPATPEEWPVAYRFSVSPEYFSVMGIAVVTGRTFEPSDRADAPPVVVVSKSTAESLWPGQNPVGETVLVGEPREPVRATVVGIVADIKHSGFEDDPRAQIYQPLLQRPSRRRYVVVGTAGLPSSTVGPLRQTLASVDPDLPVTIRAMDEVVRESTLQWSISSLLLGIFGAVALLLASLGIYGVISYSVARRRREMGIRMALGATGADIRSVVMGEAMRLTGIGLVLGLVLAALAARLMASLLYGVSPFDPVTFAIVVLVFLSTAAAASLGPARRASRTNPIGVLREE